MTTPRVRGPPCLPLQTRAHSLFSICISESSQILISPFYTRGSLKSLHPVPISFSPDFCYLFVGGRSKKTSQFIRSPPSPLCSPLIAPNSYESLMELHRKTLNVDQFFDSRLESTTLRSAWSEVRDNLEREAQTRRAFMDSITHEVINPLVSFKVSILFLMYVLTWNPRPARFRKLKIGFARGSGTR